MPYHRPVMVDEVVDLLGPCPPGPVVDATFGGGGHTRALLAARPADPIVAIDRDPDALEQAEGLGRVHLVAADFRGMADVLPAEGFDDVAGVLFDLGVSSHQLDVADRGFSYHASGPLDMRMGPDAAHTADDLVNHWSERDLADVIRRHGEERHALRIARAIVAARPLRDTAHLAEVVANAVPAADRRRRHPARRTFQALRIAVNDELAAVSEGLEGALRLLRPGGRVVVISYHSLEDRIVKRRFVAGATGCICPPDLPVCGCGRTPELRLLTRRPLTPAADEVARNPRARSAKLRAAEGVAP
ncbi:MAG: 16S rRNA (cytosine(1402)-N(4))-methyltransferase RsmH [Acidimicrobiia bacterium]|nr:16S rRNA (cytosine(1402)-N(4))-methyltransferase RsmH [Acidimicrobiia bacterium]